MEQHSQTQNDADKETRLLTDLRRQFVTAFFPISWLYWCDLLLSTFIGWGAFVVAMNAPFLSFLYIAATTTAIIALLRATIFIHELAHLKRGSIPGFELAWNLLVGVPFLLPSVMYDSHGDHHRQATFATAHDPEYAPIAQWSQFHIFRFVAGMIFVPALLALRWGVFGGPSLLLPPLRRFLLTRASSLVINPHYMRPLPQRDDHLRCYTLELATTLAFWSALFAFLYGALPLSWLCHWYIIGAGVAIVNQVRTLAAHRYQNDGRQLTTVEQLLDSINLTGLPWLTALAAPVGLRYHALHHFLPTLPYHSLGAVHRQLVAQLSPGSPYRQTEERGIFAAVQKLLQHPLSRTDVTPSLDHKKSHSHMCHPECNEGSLREILRSARNDNGKR
ncbi:MAG: fatty acid desaturase [Deltaproteobacteria bacterium]|nr:fatty acid desaturase [Deltaproteobacteria bacterium]